MRELSLDVVATVANYLIMAFGVTTTLDVKNNLRALGFKANQKEVSEYMEVYHAAFADDDMYFELDGEEAELVFETKIENGKTFRMYSFEERERECTCTECTCDITHEDEDEPADVEYVDIYDLINKNPKLSSNELAKITTSGLSSGSIRAIKANITRGR